MTLAATSSRWSRAWGSSVSVVMRSLTTAATVRDGVRMEISFKRRICGGMCWPATCVVDQAEVLGE